MTGGQRTEGLVERDALTRARELPWVVPAPRARRRRGPYDALAKPVIDRLAGLALLVLFLPVLALLAAVVRLHLGPGVLYRQVRVGLHGEPFVMLKFRTMEHDRRRDGGGYGADDPRSGYERRRCDRRRCQAAFDGLDRRTGCERRSLVERRADDRRRTHKTACDPRHTRVGRVMRRYSLDELPQLWNVVRGDLSLVGPRPELLEVVATYDHWQHDRHRVKPGITGLWQVTDRAEDAVMVHHVDTDLEYIERQSLWLDLYILACTPLAVLGVRWGRGGLSALTPD